MGKFIKAERKRAKARIGLVGPAGSGKTMSALKLAFGIVGPEGKIAVVDTEHGSASLYADFCAYDVQEISGPFTVKKYLAAIAEAERENYDILIIDSLSHAWAGPGGLLEFVDNLTDAKNKFTAWREASPQHNSLVEAMLQSSLHIIATMRSKTEYILVEDEKGKKVPKKVGLAPVQRDGLDYEFTLVFDIDKDKHTATSSKDRTTLFDGFFERLEISHGEAIRKWLDTGADVTTPGTNQPQQNSNPASTPETGQDKGKVNPLTSDLNKPVITLEQVKELQKLIKESGADEVMFLKCLKVDTLAQIPAERFEWAMKSLEAKKKKGEADSSAEVSDTNMLVATLSARNIPYQLDEQNKEIHAKPSFSDSGAKEFLKQQGFKWNSSAKAWIKMAA